MMILFFMKFAKGIPRNSTIGCTMTKNVTAKTKEECVKLEKLREKYVKQTEKNPEMSYGKWISPCVSDDLPINGKRHTKRQHELCTREIQHNGQRKNSHTYRQRRRNAFAFRRNEQNYPPAQNKRKRP